MPKQNNTAPDVTLKNLEGHPVSLSTYWQQGNNILLVFLRHLG